MGIALLIWVIYLNRLDWRFLSLLLGLIVVCSTTLGIGFYELYANGINTISSLLIPIGLAFLSIIYAVTSERRMISIGRSEYLSAMANILRTRIEYFDRTVIEPSDIEYATWQTYNYLRQTLVSRRYIEPEDRIRIIHSIEILVNHVIRDNILHLLFNRHVIHLFLCFRDLLIEFGDDFVNYAPRHEGYFEVYSDIINNPDTDGLEYTRDIIELLRENGEDEPFQLIYLGIDANQ